eukprot:scaffold11487_cov18-Tisochrysis_lutea.AAC.2
MVRVVHVSAGLLLQQEVCKLDSESVRQAVDVTGPAAAGLKDKTMQADPRPVESEPVASSKKRRLEKDSRSREQPSNSGERSASKPDEKKRGRETDAALFTGLARSGVAA